MGNKALLILVAVAAACLGDDGKETPPALQQTEPANSLIDDIDPEFLHLLDGGADLGDLDIDMTDRDSRSLAASKLFNKLMQKKLLKDPVLRTPEDRKKALEDRKKALADLKKDIEERRQRRLKKVPKLNITLPALQPHKAAKFAIPKSASVGRSSQPGTRETAPRNAEAGMKESSTTTSTPPSTRLEQLVPKPSGVKPPPAHAEIAVPTEATLDQEPTPAAPSDPTSPMTPSAGPAAPPPPSVAPSTVTEHSVQPQQARPPPSAPAGSPASAPASAPAGLPSQRPFYWSATMAPTVPPTPVTAVEPARQASPRYVMVPDGGLVKHDLGDGPHRQEAQPHSYPDEQPAYPQQVRPPAHQFPNPEQLVPFPPQQHPDHHRYTYPPNAPQIPGPGPQHYPDSQQYLFSQQLPDPHQYPYPGLLPYSPQRPPPAVGGDYDLPTKPVSPERPGLGPGGSAFAQGYDGAPLPQQGAAWYPQLRNPDPLDELERAFDDWAILQANEAKQRAASEAMAANRRAAEMLAKEEKAKQEEAEAQRRLAMERAELERAAQEALAAQERAAQDVAAERERAQRVEAATQRRMMLEREAHERAVKSSFEALEKAALEAEEAQQRTAELLARALKEEAEAKLRAEQRSALQEAIAAQQREAQEAIVAQQMAAQLERAVHQNEEARSPSQFVPRVVDDLPDGDLERERQAEFDAWKEEVRREKQAKLGAQGAQPATYLTPNPDGTLPSSPYSSVASPTLSEFEQMMADARTTAITLPHRTVRKRETTPPARTTPSTRAPLKPLAPRAPRDPYGPGHTHNPYWPRRDDKKAVPRSWTPPKARQGAKTTAWPFQNSTNEDDDEAKPSGARPKAAPRATRPFAAGALRLGSRTDTSQPRALADGKVAGLQGRRGGFRQEATPPEPPKSLTPRPRHRPFKVPERRTRRATGQEADGDSQSRRLESRSVLFGG